MYNGKKLSIFLFIGILLLAGLNPAEALEEAITDRFAGAQPLVVEERKDEWSGVRTKDALDIAVYMDLQQGYDNNVELDPNRYKDGFMQFSGTVDMIWQQTDTVELRFGTDVFNLLYYKYNRNNLLNISPYAGFNWKIFPELVLRGRVIYDYFSYPNEKESTFNGLTLQTFLRHHITQDLYHEIGYEHINRWYCDRHIYDRDAIMDRADRDDARDRIKYNIGLYGERFFFRVGNEFATNDSNDLYQEYYDYTVYRIRPSIMYYFTDRISADLGFIYKYTSYKDRRSSEDIDKKVRDNTYTINSTVYYDVDANWSVGVTYSYTENDSNDPFQEYSGSIVTAGVYYIF